MVDWSVDGDGGVDGGGGVGVGVGVGEQKGRVDGWEAGA